MALFVHLTEEKNRNSILSNGIKQEKIHYEDVFRGVFCMPVISDFYATHQWLREIKMNRSANNIIGVYFKIPDDETVFYGQYRTELTKSTAAQAHKAFNENEDKMGFQVIVARKITKREITKTKNLPQVIGWRHFPNAHETTRCLCPACLLKGTYGASRTKEAQINKLFKELRNSSRTIDKLNTLNEIAYSSFKIKLQDPQDEELLIKLSGSEDAGIKGSAIKCLSVLRGSKYFDLYLSQFYETTDLGVADQCLSALILAKGEEVSGILDHDRCSEEKKRLIEEYNNW